MGPIIILDKSALQGLSHDEIIFLYKYYIINITPVLIAEILGDLKKPSKHSSFSKDEVMHLSKKLSPIDSAINVYYRRLIESSLLGYAVTMDGRPIIGGGKQVEDEDGRRGVILDETPEEKAICRWRNGKFEETEEILADRWREISKSFNLNEIKENYKFISDNLKITDNLMELSKKIDNLLLTPKYQTELITLLIREFLINKDLASKIHFRWKQKNYISLKDFAPFAFYCLKVNMLFYIGLFRNLIGTKSTNRIDLEYIYYLPFSMVFSSNDNFHKMFAQIFLNVNQEFVLGKDLKADLRMIYNKWNSLNDEEKIECEKKYEYCLPDNSITYKLWKKFLYRKETINEDIKSASLNITAEELVQKIKKLKELNPDIESTKKQDFDKEEVDFIVRKRYISEDDPCPCGSGKKFKDCHLKRIKGG